MKIAIIPGQFLVSPHAFILDQIFVLVDNGYDIEILSFSSIKREFITQDVVGYDLLSKTHFLIPPANKFIRIKSAIRTIACNFLSNRNEILKSLNYDVFMPDSG